jgi:hypothetical protein
LWKYVANSRYYFGQETLGKPRQPYELSFPSFIRGFDSLRPLQHLAQSGPPNFRSRGPALREPLLEDFRGQEALDFSGRVSLRVTAGRGLDAKASAGAKSSGDAGVRLSAGSAIGGDDSRSLGTKQNWRASPAHEKAANRQQATPRGPPCGVSSFHRTDQTVFHHPGVEERRMSLSTGLSDTRAATRLRATAWRAERPGRKP